MNNKRRKIKGEAIELLYSAKDLLETIADEEEEAYDNMPEGLQGSTKGEEIAENVDILRDVIWDLETMIDNLETI